MRSAPSALAIFGGRGIFTFGLFKKPPGTPSLATATSIPWPSAFLRPADASEVDSEFTSRPNASRMKAGPLNAAHAHRMARLRPREMLFFMSSTRSGASELVLCVNADREDGHGAAIAIVRWVIDPLIIEGEMSVSKDRERIIGLHDLLRAGMRQPAVAHQNAESAGVQKPLACRRYSVHDRRRAHGILAPVPAHALQRETGSGGAIDVGKFVDFHIAAGVAHPCKESEAFGDLLFDAQARPGPRPVAANRCDVDGRSGGLGSGHGIVEQSHASAGVEDGNKKFAGPAAELVAFLDFEFCLEFVERRFE